MRVCVRYILGALAFVGTLFGAVVACPARADVVRPHRASLDYHADETCPDRAEFVERVRARVPEVELSEAGAASETYVVTLARSEAGFVGRLAAAVPGRSAAARELTDATCAELASALALILAIELTESEASRPAIERPVPTIVPRAPSREKERAAVYAIVGGAATSGLGRALAPALQGGLELRISGTATWLGRPALRAAGAVAFGPTIVGSEGNGDLTLLSGAVRACAFSLPALPPSMLIESCVGGEVGALRAEGTTSRSEAVSSRLWSAAATLLHFLWWPRASIYIDSEIGLVVPTTKYRTYLVSPDVDLFVVPAVLYRWSLGIGVRFL